jgi:hypothetical protein
MGVRSGRSRSVAGIVLALLATLAVGAETPYREITPSELFPGATFDPAIPTQKKAVGVEHGHRPIRHGEVLSYFRDLAESSPNAVLMPYARSHEGRELVALAVSDEETIENLQAFRDAHARRVDPRGRTAEQDAAVLAGAKAVAWVAYGIHGDELSSVDAASAVAYWLIAGEDERARAMRRDLVILIDPCENPDGRERFLSQTTAFAHKVPNPDFDDLSHTTVWPWGRGNHYLFDLNRDWFSLVHPESARSTVIAGWNAQLMVDSHEMGSDDTYLFPPPRHPFNPHASEHVEEWRLRFSADQARALDARGYGYYTREWNEEFFPGYGSSWSTYLGSVGILYEMSGTEGTLVKKSTGVVRTYAQAVEHQVASSVANLGTLLDHREELLRDYVASRREAVRRGAEGPMRAWVLPLGKYPDRTRALADLLRRQTIEVLELASDVEASGLRDARTGAEQRVSLSAGSYMVPLDQPAGNLARVLLDPHVPMGATFFREEREYLERGKGSRLYDTTAWSLVLSYGVEAYWSGLRPGGDWQPMGRTMAAQAGSAGGALQMWAPGAPAPDASPAPVSISTNLPAAERGEVFAYAFEGTSDAAAFALGDLLQRGLAVKVADRPFEVDGHALDRGAVLVLREENEADVRNAVAEVAARRGIEPVAITTARAQQGPDLGGDHFLHLVAPKIGVWTGYPVSPSDYGHMWHLLDDRMGLRFSAIDLGRARFVDLSRYNVLVFPPVRGGAAGYKHMLGEQGIANLRSWIDAGGTAIGYASGAAFLADKELGLTRTRLRRQALDRYPPAVLSIDAEEVDRAGRFRAVGLRAVPEDGGDKSADSKGEGKKRSSRPAGRTSPYDVAPIVGAGARPFVGDTPQGTPLALRPRALSEWLKPLVPPGPAASKGEAMQKHVAAADRRLRLFSPQGAYLRVELDNELWLTWGMGSEVDALVGTTMTLVTEAPSQVPARFVDVERLHLGGLLWPEAAGRIAHTAYATRDAVGRGQVILFVDTPNFRAWTLGTRRMLVNALLYGPGLGTRWSRPW